MSTNNPNFIKEHAIYQIYPISFCDSNNDGYGDINGIISKLDYIKDLGIRIIWLSPIYKSPMVDMGYDVEDYYSINPFFGTMDDFDNLIKEANKRDIKIIMDLVVNHTSSNCMWFKKALEDKNSKYRDYYIFKEGKDGKYPNNWESNFTGTAWEKVKNEDNTYYLHLFTKEQPDLNFRCEDVIKEVESIIAFWMDKGVYGFRCDVISAIYKESYENGIKRKLGTPIGLEHYIATKGNHEILKRIKENVVSPRGGILLGECFNINIDQANEYLKNGELDTFYQNEIAFQNQLFNIRVKPYKFKKVLIKRQENVSWNGNLLENHDQHRVASKYIKGKYVDQGEKMLLTLIFTLKGTPMIYMGEEVGAKDYLNKLKFEERSDIVSKNVFKIVKKYHLPNFIAKKIASNMGRDDERAPMAFNLDKNYGFSSSDKTRQKINEASKKYNKEAQINDKNSIYNYFIKLNNIYESNEILKKGEIKFLDKKNKNVLVYKRYLNDLEVTIVLNLSNKKRKYKNTFKDEYFSNYSLNNEKYLKPYESRIYFKK